jgi:hypothetical protein
MVGPVCPITVYSTTGVRFGRPRKLTAHQGQEALARLAAGETQADVARTYNVDATTIGRLQAIARGRAA